MMNIKDMKLATGSGKTVAYFRVEWPGYMVINECKLVEGKNGLFAGMPQKEYTAAGVKKYKAIVYLEKALQEKVNAAAVEAYRLLGGAQPEPKEEEPLW
jgi:DNA-binding cell septation regulator SpoVG